MTLRLRDRFAGWAAQTLTGRQVTVSDVAESPNYAAQSVDQMMSMFENAQAQALGGGVSLRLTESQARREFVRWQFAAATTVAEAVLLTPWTIQVRTGDGWEDAPDHPADSLLRFVNPYLTGPELLYWSVVELMLVGKCYWHIVDNGLAEPGELWPMLGSMKAKVDKEGMLEKWVQSVTVDGVPKDIDYTPEEIVYLRLPSPGDVWTGQGPIMAAGSAIRLDQQLIQAQWSALKQGIFPFAILLLKERDAERRRQFMSEFNEKYAGATKRGVAIGLNADKVSILTPGAKPSEMGFVESSIELRDQILGIARVPKSILGLTDKVPLAVAQAMEYVFAKYNIAPKLVLIAARLNQDLIEPAYGEDTRLEFASPVPLDLKQERAQQETDARTFVKSPNEMRADLGLEPADWGERPLTAAGVPVGGAQPEPPPATGEGTQSLMATRQRLIRVLTEHIPELSALLDPATGADATLAVPSAYTTAQRGRLMERATIHKRRIEQLS